MTSEASSWDRVKQVLQAALERKPEDRHAFLDAACGDNRSLRAEVDSLLLAHGAAGSFAERPAIDAVTPGSAAGGELPDRALRRGDRLGPYEIVEPLGAGGMGEATARAIRAWDVSSLSRCCRRIFGTIPS